MRAARTIGVLGLGLLLLLLLAACGADVPTEALQGRELRVARGGAHPSAADFLTDEARALCEQQGIEVAFVETPDFDVAGEQAVVLSVGDRTVETGCLVVDDVTPPALVGVTDTGCLVGEGAVLREGVSARDDCFGPVVWTVDASTLDTSRAGLYVVYYRAEDASGNRSEQMAYVTVYAEDITEQMLGDACDEYLARTVPEGATREQTCRLIYAGVQQSIDYWPISDKSSAVRAAYHAMFVDGRGDCYSYFAAAHALLVRAGVECLAIERTHADGEETHFWLMVNLADEGEAARWYHFDPTELDTGGFSHDGCLFTDAELDAYNTYKPGFYDYDRAAYPASAKESLR